MHIHSYNIAIHLTGTVAEGWNVSTEIEKNNLFISDNIEQITKKSLEAFN